MRVGLAVVRVDLPVVVGKGLLVLPLNLSVVGVNTTLVIAVYAVNLPIDLALCLGHFALCGGLGLALRGAHLALEPVRIESCRHRTHNDRIRSGGKRCPRAACWVKSSKRSNSSRVLLEARSL
jgi:hypothetical protein